MSRSGLPGPACAQGSAAGDRSTVVSGRLHTRKHLASQVQGRIPPPHLVLNHKGDVAVVLVAAEALEVGGEVHVAEPIGCGSGRAGLQHL